MALGVWEVKALAIDIQIEFNFVFRFVGWDGSWRWALLSALKHESIDWNYFIKKKLLFAFINNNFIFKI